MRVFVKLVLLLYGLSLGAVTLEAAKGKTEFMAIGRPSALKISGSGHGPRGELNFSKSGDQILLSGSVSVDLATFDTGIAMRDRHMKEKYLEVDKYQLAVLTLTDVLLPNDVLQKGGETRVQGKLNLHGQDKVVEVEIKIMPTGDKVTSTSQFKLKLSEFAIPTPKFALITVADEVVVSAQTEVPIAALKEWQ